MNKMAYLLNDIDTLLLFNSASAWRRTPQIKQCAQQLNTVNNKICFTLTYCQVTTSSSTGKSLTHIRHITPRFQKGARPRAHNYTLLLGHTKIRNYHIHIQ